MSDFSKIIVGMFRTFGNVLSFGKKKEKYKLPHTLPNKNFLGNVDGYHVPKKNVGPASTSDNSPLPKTSTKPPKLSVIEGGKGRKNS